MPLRTPIFLALALALASTLRAQTTPAPTPTLKVYSRETVVDTTVTDSKGNPVHGLLKPDFTIKEDRKPQTIRGFEEFRSDTPVQPPPKLPPNVYTNLQAPPSSSTVNILLLDFLNTAPVVSATCCGTDATVGPEDLQLAGRAERLVKQEAMKYLATMPPGTRVAALGMSNGLRVLQDFTSDAALLRAAVDTMDYNMDGRADNGEQLCTELDTRNRMTMEVLNQIAADTSAIKGRKNLIWFTVGVPALNNPSARPPCMPDYQSDLTKTYDLLMAAQITLFPVDSRGLPPIPSYVQAPAIPDFEVKVATEQLAMEAWAEATGGTAYYNSNDLAKQIAKAIDKGANYYTLTYSPPGQKYDYGHHNIKISIDQPDLHLVYRKSYDAIDPATIKPSPGLTLATTLPLANPPDTHALMRTAMSRNLPTSTNLLFDVQVEPSTEPAKPTDPAVFGNLDPKLTQKPLSRYSFQYVLPARQLTFTQTPDGNQKTALEFDIAAYDAEGKLVTSLGQSIKPVITADQRQQLLKGPFRFFQQLDLPPGQLFLRIGILDSTSNKIGTLEIPLTVDKKTGASEEKKGR